ARFEPAAPRVEADEYTRRVRAVTSHAAWAPPLPPAERVVIPGFANLRAFSAAEEAAVKAGLGSRFWTFVLDELARDDAGARRASGRGARRGARRAGGGA